MHYRKGCRKTHGSAKSAALRYPLNEGEPCSNNKNIHKLCQRRTTGNVNEKYSAKIKLAIVTGYGLKIIFTGHGLT